MISSRLHVQVKTAEGAEILLDNGAWLSIIGEALMAGNIPQVILGEVYRVVRANRALLSAGLFMVRAQQEPWAERASELALQFYFAGPRGTGNQHVVHYNVAGRKPFFHLVENKYKPL